MRRDQLSTDRGRLRFGRSVATARQPCRIVTPPSRADGMARRQLVAPADRIPAPHPMARPSAEPVDRLSGSPAELLGRRGTQSGAASLRGGPAGMPG